MKKTQLFKNGIKMGLPIGLGYFAVSVSLGIFAKKAGLDALQAGISSFVLTASAGQYAAYSTILDNASYLVAALMVFVANARYMLMSCAISQRLSATTSMWHRLLIGFSVTDEMFGSAIACKGNIEPMFYYGMMVTAIPMWTIGTVLGVVLGNVLPANVVCALGVSLYGMFLAIIVPPSKTNKVIFGSVLVSMILSFVCASVPVLKNVFAHTGDGTRVILLTVIISTAVAILFPIEEEEQNEA